jgi:hypothetical protein
MGLRPEAPAELHGPLSIIQSMSPRFVREPRLFCRMGAYTGQPETVKVNTTFAAGGKR